MSIIETKQLTKILMDKYAFLGALTYRSMFGGFGLLLDNVMFAWVFDSKLYLRANQTCLSEFIALKMHPLSLPTGVSSKLLHYYCVTDTLWQNESLLNRLIQLAITSAMSDKQNKLRLRESRLRDLPNMTLSLERLLMQIGIANINQLRQLGAVETFYQLKQYNKHLSINVLYTLASAINGHHVAILSRDEKNKLKEQFGKITQNNS